MSSSLVTSGYSGDSSLLSKCKCGLDVTIFTAKTQENPGRLFFRCTSKHDARSWTTERGGHFFKWVEDGVLEEVEDALPRVAIMVNELSKAKSEANELKALMEEVKEEAMVNKMEIRKMKVCFKVCFGWICVLTIVLVYVLFGQANEKKILKF